MMHRATARFNVNNNRLPAALHFAGVGALPRQKRARGDHWPRGEPAAIAPCYYLLTLCP
jgi:hypothetical protein